LVDLLVGKDELERPIPDVREPIRPTVDGVLFEMEFCNPSLRNLPKGTYDVIGTDYLTSQPIYKKRE
jgi:hypothetical protein